ncbi:MAG: glycosyltransferase family 2 protein [Candidatus Harrisonbacteria bacterium]|nr:glycosyltransferase family 2 protein [Candidatus Harrisonbacteria bacterium]
MKLELLSVIVPAYNEGPSIEKALEAVFAVPVKKEVIVVDDGSTDETAEIVEKLSKVLTKQNKYSYLKELKFVKKEENSGKGSAIRSGLSLVSGDVVLIQDADLELDPNEYPKLLAPFKEMEADIVFGSRFRREGIIRVQQTFHFLGNKALTWFSNLCTGFYLTDMETGFKVFRSDLMKGFKLISNRFGIEPELAARAAQATRKKRLNFYEVSVSYRPRTIAEGKKMRFFRGGVIALLAVIYFNFINKS